MSTMPPVALRVGFIGVDSSAFAMAAEPNTSAVAVIFSSIEQLRKYFEQHPRSICHTWVAFFHELAAANVKDAQEEEQGDDGGGQQQQEPQQQQQRRSRYRRHAKALVSRKLALITGDAERLISGQDIVALPMQQLVGDEGQRLLQKKQQEREQKLRNRESGSSRSGTDDEDEFYFHDNEAVDAPFFWVDMLTPPCRVHVTVSLPVPERRAAAASLSSSSSSFSDVIEAPAVAQWRVGKVVQRIAERTGIHPHNLEVYATYPERFFAHLGDAPAGAEPAASSSSSTGGARGGGVQEGGTLISRHRPLLDLVKSSREVHLCICMARPPVCCVKVVEAKVAECASRVMYAKANRRNTQMQARDSSRLSFHDASFGGGMLSLDHQQQLAEHAQSIDAYASDPFSVVEAGSKRIVTLRHVHWASTLGELHRDCNQALAPLRGRGFLCLDPTVIQTWPRDSVSFGNTGSVGGGQVPVFAPEMTLRQIARLSAKHQQATAGENRGNSNNIGDMNSSCTVRLYIVVNSETDVQRPRMLSARATHDNSILEEADDARWNLLEAVFPQARQTRTQRASRFKKQNVDSSSSVVVLQPQQQQTARQVRFDEESTAAYSYPASLNNSFEVVVPNQQPPPQPIALGGSFGLVSPLRRRPPPDFDHQQDNISSVPSSPTSPRPPPPRTTPRRSDSPSASAAVRRPHSPDHTEGVEAFVAVPTASGGSEVIRLLLPDGYFPLRRLKRFLKMQAEQGGAGALSPRKDADEYKIYFGPELLTNENDDVKRWVNPTTKIVFLNAA